MHPKTFKMTEGYLSLRNSYSVLIEIADKAGNVTSESMTLPGSILTSAANEIDF